MAENLVPNVLGLHSNSPEKINDFVKEKAMLFSNDSDYLGYGMYFWDNISNARYWARKKIKKEKRSSYDIASANLMFDSPILDLTDKEEIKKVKLLWLEFCKLQGSEPKQPLGVILDILFKFFEDIFSNIKITKCIGSYDAWSKNKFLTSLKNNYIDDRPKVIYSVRCEKKIKNQMFVESVQY